MSRQPCLSGRRILIVEDDYYLATDACQMLVDSGAEVVGPFGTADEATSELKASAGIDSAVIDINLGHGPAFELARTLRAAEIPFLFATGYGVDVIPDDLGDVVRIEKPFRRNELIDAVVQLGG